MTTVLITGAAGFCGPHLARRLRNEGGMRIVGLSRREPQAIDVAAWDAFVRVDARSAGEVNRVFESVRPDWVFHLAGGFAGSDAELQAANAGGTEIVLQAVRAYVPRAAVLVAGSAAEYGDVPLCDQPVRETQPCRPRSAYGRSKLAATGIALAHARMWGTNVSVARPFNIVGAGVPVSLVTGALIERIRRVVRGERAFVAVGNLDTERDFVAVDDVVEGFVGMIRGGIQGEIVNLSSGRSISIRALIDLLREVTGLYIPLEIDPALIRPGDVPVSYGSWQKAGELLGYKPATPLADALAAAWKRAAFIDSSIGSLSS